MAAARLEIDDAIAGRDAAPGIDAPGAAGRRAPSLLLAAGALTIVLLAGIALGAWLRSAPADADDGATITSIAAPQGVVAAFDRGFAISPDGRTLVTSARSADGRRALWKRCLADLTFEPM
jgi:hypothetical protein